MMTEPQLIPVETDARRVVLNRLLVIPEEIAHLEYEVMRAEARLRDCEHELQDAEDALILGAGIDGKNETIRAAQIRKKTLHEQCSVDTARWEYQRLKVALRILHTKHSSLRAAARLLSAGE